MNSILKFLREWWPFCLVISLIAALAGTAINGIQVSKERRQQEANEVARLEAGYKYKVEHHHAQKYSYADVYYTNSYSTDGRAVKFVDHTGRQMMLVGDVSISETQWVHTDEEGN